MFLQLAYNWTNSLLNTFSRIFRHSGLTDLGLVIAVLYGLSKVSFICDDSTFIYLSGCMVLIAPGLNRLLGGSLAQVEKVKKINKIISKDSSSQFK